MVGRGNRSYVCEFESGALVCGDGAVGRRAWWGRGRGGEWRYENITERCEGGGCKRDGFYRNDRRGCHFLRHLEQFGVRCTLVVDLLPYDTNLCVIYLGILSGFKNTEATNTSHEKFSISCM